MRRRISINDLPRAIDKARSPRVKALLTEAQNRLAAFNELMPYWGARSYAEISSRATVARLRYSSTQGTGIIGSVRIND